MSSTRLNRDILTGGKKYAQKQANKYGVDEVAFDPEARKEYLTGFHKRKLQRQKKAQEHNKEQERLARIEERKKVRDERKKDFENQLHQLQDAAHRIADIGTTGQDSNEEINLDRRETQFEELKSRKQETPESDDNQDQDSDDDSKQPNGILRHKEVYKLDEDGASYFGQDTAVDDETVVTVDSLDNPAFSGVQNISIEAAAKLNNVNLNISDKVLDDSIKRAKSYAVVCGVSKPSFKDKIKKKKKFRYLSKAERRDNARKQKIKNRAKRP
ncbi:uncharacterized protein PRCAT00001524001 [Priceomyces carsonii]|uniref:uncharacterized protein n=1 Tax=Priceomyces carsonii TaxID=28549 RepID=UPI002EDB5DDF|nr:unnamed protein product [Priceomyces carsonii]